jgi:hypothetical protein
MAQQLSFASEPVERVYIEGDVARAVSPEGKEAGIKLEQMLDRARPHRIDSGPMILSDGVKLVKQTQCGLVLVHQTPPRIWNFKWIANDSPSRWGAGTKYRAARLALPYLVVLAVFEQGPGGVLQLTGRNECFFTNEPLSRAGVESKLCFPALLNCSRFPNDPSNSLAWICTQHLSRKELAGRADSATSVPAGLTALLHHLLETGFNFSSEDHELNSWYSETVAAGVDARIESVEAWEAASAEDPLFALEVPWLDTGMTLDQIVGRVIDMHADMRPKVTSANDIARIVFNASQERKTS